MREVVVIGGGFAGCAVALELAGRGVAVNLLETHRLGSAATGASAGMLAPQYESSGTGALFSILVQARAYFRDFAGSVQALCGEPMDLRWDGMLVANLTDQQHRDAEEISVRQRSAGHTAELLEVHEATAIQPGITHEACSYLWLPSEGQVDSQRLPDLLQSALNCTSVRVLRGRRATELRIRAGRVEGVVLEDGRVLPADAVIIAAGAWSGLLAGLPRPLPVRPVRGHLLQFPPGSVPLTPLLAGHAGRYLVPRTDGSLLAGSTMDETGFDRSIDEMKLRQIQDAVARLLPALERLRPVSFWADLRPISVDGLPIVGGDPEVLGLFYATGYGRNGILLSPLAARVLAGLVLEGDLPAAWASFTPARFRASNPRP